MASPKTPQKRDRQSGRTDQDFNKASGAEAEATPRLNKSQLLAQLKKILPILSGNGSITTRDGEVLTPTANQKNMMKQIQDKDVTLVEGTFGTGKTMWACYKALESLVNKESNRITLNAPAIEAGENIGFLKGDLNQKMLPHVNQILEAFDDFIGKDLRTQMMEADLIVIEPHAFLRGRSMKKTFFILDECQNASGPNLQTALSRIGNNSKFVFMGDNQQNDRTTSDSAFTAFIGRYATPRYESFIGHARLGAEDVRRHPLLKLIVENGDERPLEGYENHRGAAMQPSRRNNQSPPAQAPRQPQ